MVKDAEKLILLNMCVNQDRLQYISKFLKDKKKWIDLALKKEKHYFLYKNQQDALNNFIKLKCSLNFPFEIANSFIKKSLGKEWGDKSKNYFHSRVSSALKKLIDKKILFRINEENILEDVGKEYTNIKKPQRGKKKYVYRFRDDDPELYIKVRSILSDYEEEFLETLFHKQLFEKWLKYSKYKKYGIEGDKVDRLLGEIIAFYNYDRQLKSMMPYLVGPDKKEAMKILKNEKRNKRR